ncbi:ribonuclease P protein component [Phyllobacterium salinisoli]|uniref:Ribonuclease P protein component n=1 Tax=Phyllobacterium salinisoli TaxID=1899321 RepID=A0A368K8H7_9HYPH|nr:ribonuclease P protein component [Phyllobacterium salinisoli]RCS24783.1 ribonuclease P protein component [Phyllobacterium salinisoli]
MNDQKTLRLRKRAEFLTVRSGEKRRGPFFLLEMKTREPAESAAAKAGNKPRVGITVTKKNGNAVIRNRIRRRLREAVRTKAAGDMADGTDYVIVARRDALSAPFAELVRELAKRVSKKAEQKR